MGLFSYSAGQKYRPKKIKFSDLYHQETSQKSIPAAAKQKIRKTLKKEGYQSDEITKIISQDRLIEPKKMKEIAETLSGRRITGFQKKQPAKAIDKLIKKETARNLNIARLKRERRREAMKESLKTDQSRKNIQSKSSSGRRIKLPF